MRAFSSFWILIATVGGAAYGASGYNHESLRGLIVLSSFLVVFVIVAVVFMPVLVRANDGRWDWRKVRTETAKVVAGGVVLTALMLAAAGVYRLAADATGGWPGGWGEAAVGAATGAAVGLSVRFAVGRLQLFERLGIDASDAEPGAAADRRGM